MSVSSLRGKVALITGASSGIGQATATLFSRLGALMTITGRNAANLEETKKQCVKAGAKPDDVLVHAADVTNTEQLRSLVEETVKRFGHLDVLINNAGAGSADGVVGCSIAQDIELYDHVMNVNSRSVVVLTQIALPHLKKSKGVIVNTSSIGSTRPLPTFLYYQMAKAAIDHFTRNLAVQLGPEGVRVNAVNPGFIKSHFTDRYGLPQEHITAYEKSAAASTALKRAGKPEDIAEAIAYLASDQSSYMTGHMLVVDGGLSIAQYRDTSGH